MVQLDQLTSYCDQLLQVEEFGDYCPNGMQVEGKPDVKYLISGVTASYALLEVAVQQQADAILVHHGYFWKGEAPSIVGVKAKRIRALLNHDISLIAYHLPLDAHQEFGNNAQLARLLNFEVLGRFGFNGGAPLAMHGRLTSAMNSHQLKAHLDHVLGRTCLHIDGAVEPINRLAWCTGAAQSYIEAAAQLGVDAFISGEISEQTVHLARELGVHYFAAGHHATERYGVRALGEHLAERFSVKHRFIDIDNPV